MDNAQPDYQFILDPNRPTKQPRLGNGSFKQRIILVVLAGLGILFAGLIAWMVIGSIGGEKFDDIVSVGKTQQKILFASDLALKESPNQDTKSFIATLRGVVGSDYQKLVSYLNGRGQKNKVKQIGNGKDASTEADFEDSVKAGKVDEVFYKTVDELFADYESGLKAALEGGKTKARKDILNTALSNLGLVKKAKSL